MYIKLDLYMQQEGSIKDPNLFSEITKSQEAKHQSAVNYSLHKKHSKLELIYPTVYSQRILNVSSSSHQRHHVSNNTMLFIHLQNHERKFYQADIVKEHHCCIFVQVSISLPFLVSTCQLPSVFPPAIEKAELPLLLPEF